MEQVFRHSDDTVQLSDIRAVLIGSGNVATRLGLALYDKLKIVQVYSPDISHASKLADLIGAEALANCEKITKMADVYIVAISDDSIAELALQMKDMPGAWLHTSGSVPMTVLDGVGDSHGVLYPLQTFSKHVAVDFRKVHFLTEASTADALTLADTIARATGSKNIHHVSSEQRQKIHVAAVFACNFANYMWINSEELLAELGIGFDALQPLVQTTLDNAIKVGSIAGQTGPARRGDKHIIEHHTHMLNSEKAEIYKLLSANILKRFNNE